MADTFTDEELSVLAIAAQIAIRNYMEFAPLRMRQMGEICEILITKLREERATNVKVILQAIMKLEERSDERDAARAEAAELRAALAAERGPCRCYACRP